MNSFMKEVFSHRNQSIDLLCKSIDGFYMIETFVIKDFKKQF